MSAWLAAPPSSLAAVHGDLAARLGEGWRPVWSAAEAVARAPYQQWAAADLDGHYAALARAGRAEGPGLLHEPTGVLFRVVPGGEFVMGLSDEETAMLLGDEARAADQDGELAYIERQAPWMRPARVVKMRPYLLSAAPLVGQQLRALGLDIDAVDENGDVVDRLFAGDDQITYVEPAEVAVVVGQHGFRLPSEAEWEHACRAGTRTLFFWGDEVPDAPNGRANQLGLVELGNHVELCADFWHMSYEGAPLDQRPWVEAPWVAEGDDPAPRPVVRGGAADCYPWQGCGEWQLMLSCLRRPHDTAQDFYGERQVALRLARDL